MGIRAYIVRELEYFEKLDELFERAVLHQNGHHVIWVMMYASYDDDMMIVMMQMMMIVIMMVVIMIVMI